MLENKKIPGERVFCVSVFSVGYLQFWKKCQQTLSNIEKVKGEVEDEY